VKAISFISREVCEPLKELSALVHHDRSNGLIAYASDIMIWRSRLSYHDTYKLSAYHLGQPT
jgi:hypothetical protein